MRIALSNRGTEQDAMGEIVARARSGEGRNGRVLETQAYAELLLGCADQALATLSRIPPIVARREEDRAVPIPDWVPKIRERAVLISDLIRNQSPQAAINQLDAWCDQQADALGIRRAPVS